MANNQDLSLALRYLPERYKKAYAEGKLDDTDVLDWAKRSGLFQSEEEKPAPVVKQEPVPKKRNALDSVSDAASAGLRRTGAGMIQKGIDSESIREREEADPWYKRDVLDLVGFGPDERARADADIASRLQGYKQGESYSDIQRRMEGQAAASEQRVAQDVASVRNPVLRSLAQAGTDAAGSPLSALSVFGGPLGAVSGADSYARTYREARKAGVSIEEADKIAKERMAVESTIGMVPAAKLLGPLAKLGRGVTGGTASKFAGRVATNAAGEGVNEVLTDAVNTGLDFKRSLTSDDKKVREYSDAQVTEKIAQGHEGLLRSFLAGAVGGGVISSPTTALQISAENGRLAGQMLEQHAKNKDLFPSRQRKPDTPRTDEIDFDAPDQITEPVADLFGGNLPDVTPEQRDAFEAQRSREMEEDAAFSINRRQRVAEEMARREFDGANQQLDVARQQVEAIQERIEAGNFSNADLTALGAAQRRARGLENIVSQMRAALEQPQAATRAVVPEQDAPEQGVLPVDTKQPAELEMEAATGQAKSALEKDAKDIRKSATKAQKAARTKFSNQLMNEARDMKPEEAVKYVAERMIAWDKDNQLDTYVNQIKAKKVQGGATTRRGPAPKQQAPVMSTEDILKNLGDDVTLAQQGEGSTGVTADQVINTIKGNKGKSTGNTAAKLIGDGNLVVLDSADQIPSDAVKSETTAGWYDGKRTYVIANQLDAGNIMGELLNVAAHETKHAADLAGGKTVKATLGSFVGENANRQLVRKIEAMASSGDQLAIDAVKAAKAGSNEATYSLELPAYYINVTRAARDLSPAHRRLTNNVVSAVRTAAKKTVGSEDVNLRDVAYLSDKLLRTAAESGESMQAQGAPSDLAMIYDINARDFERAEDMGLVYRSMDGVPKFVVSDKGSKVKPDAFLKIKNAPLDTGVPLSEVMDHPVLFRNMPEAKDIPIFFEDFVDRGQYGVFRQKDETIGVSSRIAGQPEEMRRTLLHEIQHWVQNQHPERRKHFFRDLMPKEDQDFLEEMNAASNKIGAGVEVLIKGIELVVPTIQDAAVQNAIKSVLSNPKLTPLGKSLTAYDKLPESIKGVPALFDAKTAVDFNLAIIDANRTRYKKLDDELFDAYESNITEAEAFFTEDNRDQLTPPENPEERGKTRRPPQLQQQPQGEGLAFDISVLRKGAQRLTSPDNKVMDTLRKGFSGFGALGRELAAIKENSDGFAALRSHNAMNHFHEINRGITQAAKIEVARGKYKDEASAEKDIRDQVQKVMTMMEGEPDQNRRVSIMNSLVRRYPALKGFPKAVQEVNELSRTIIRQMLETNPNPTEDDRKLIQTIMSNTFRYTTRMYAAFQGEAGRRYSKRIKKEYDKAMEAVKGGKAVPPKYKESFRTWNNAARYLIENDLTIPDESEIGGLSTDRLTRLYDTWVEPNAAKVKKNAKQKAIAEGMKKSEADQLAREALIAGLLEVAPDINDSNMRNMADNLIIGMLGLQDAGGPFASYYRGFKQDRGILEKREQLPQEIRELFGEIKDPATRLAVTIAKQGELAARTRLLLDMRNRGEGKWVVKAKDKGNDGNEKFSVQLNGDGYGPLNGWYTTPAIASSISDNLEMFSTMGDALAKGYANSDALAMAMARSGTQKLATLAGWQKLATVVFDLYNMSMNALGSPIVLFANGIYNPLQWAGGAKVAAQVIWDTGMQGGVELSKDTQDAIRYGVLDSARVQEIRRTPQGFVRDLISTRPQAVSKTLSGARRSTRTGIEMFAMADAWVKIVAFQERTDTLRKFYKAEGITKTEHELKSEAADQIKDTNITYARTGAAIRAAERLGVTTFMPYFVSVPRAISYNVALSVKDMIRAVNAKTPEGKAALGAASVRRMAGVSVATAGVVYAMKAIAASVNDEDEEKLAAMQKLMYPDARFADSFFLGYDDKGVPMFARFSRVDPFGPVNDFLRILNDDVTSPQDKTRHMGEMFRDLLITNRVVVTGTQLAGDIILDADVDIANKETKLERMGPKTANFIKDKMEALPGLDGDDAESMLAFVDSFTPGFADMFDPNNKGIAQESEPYAAALGQIITYLGGRMDRADPQLAAYTAGKKLEDIRKFGRKRQSDGLKAGEDIYTLQSRFLEDAQDEYEAMRDVADVWDGLTNGLDLSPRQAKTIMEDDARLKQTDIRNLNNGQLSTEAHEWISQHSRLINEDSVRKALIGFEKRKLTPEEKQKAKAYLANMKALGYKVQE